jgi:hypothetical protein
MDNIWFSDPFTICFELAGAGLLAFAFWFIKMDLQHRPKKQKKLP